MESAKSGPISELLPPEILSLPRVEVPIAGVDGFCLKNDEKQVVFFVFEEGVSFPDHSHPEQKGILISGEMTIEVDGQTNLYQSGDHYNIPAGVNHRTNFSQRTVLIDMSDAPDRYTVSE